MRPQTLRIPAICCLAVFCRDKVSMPTTRPSHRYGKIMFAFGAVVASGCDDDVLVVRARRLGQHAGGDGLVVGGEALAVDVAEQLAQPAVLRVRCLELDDLLLQRLDLGLEPVALLLGPGEVGAPAVRILEGARDALARDLERVQRRLAEALGGVQRAVVGLAQVDREQHERDDDERRRHEPARHDALVSRRGSLSARPGKSAQPGDPC